MFRENLAHAFRRGIAESVRWVRRLGCRAFARRYASPRFGFLFGVSHSRSGASAAWWEIIFGSSTSHRHRERMVIDRRGSLSSGAGEACSAYAACETPNHIESIGSVFADFYRPSVWIERAAVVERDRTVSVRRGPPNHALEATAYRAPLRLLVRLGLFRLPMRLTSQGCASALIR